MNLDIQKPHIIYPCVWEYRLIGESEEQLRALIFEVMPREYSLQLGKRSSKGHFVSIYVSVEVQSEAERNHIFALLQQSEATKMVL